MEVTGIETLQAYQEDKPAIAKDAKAEKILAADGIDMEAIFIGLSKLEPFERLAIMIIMLKEKSAES